MNFKKGDIVRFLPDYSDSKHDFDYVLIENPDRGRVKVMPINSGMEIPPVQVIELTWIKEKVLDIS